MKRAICLHQATYRKITAVLVAAILIGIFGACGKEPEPTVTTVPTTVTTVPTTEETTVPPTTEETVPTEPEPESFVLSFAGDCTLGSGHGAHNRAGSFIRVVGDNYDYPFKKALPYFETDDFTLVNLEGTFTEYNVKKEKTFCFRAPVEYVKILTAGSVEAVNLANNHSHDYWETGYKDTKTALESENITYVENHKTALYTTESGLKIGLYAYYFSDLSVINKKEMTKAIKALREDGAELVITSFHWGVEGSYRPIQSQKESAYAAIDAGANIVYGHHPHVLQPIEDYNGGVIYYSLGNFSFGGNRNPVDKDTAVIQQIVLRDPDGTIRLGDTIAIPFALSSVTEGNDYQPTPYDITEIAHDRTISKLDGTFKGKDLKSNSAAVNQPATDATEPPQGSDEVTTPAPDVLE